MLMQMMRVDMELLHTSWIYITQPLNNKGETSCE